MTVHVTCEFTLPNTFGIKEKGALYKAVVGTVHKSALICKQTHGMARSQAIPTAILMLFDHTASNQKLAVGMA